MDPEYWYGKAGAFWEAYEEAIGPGAMRAVLAATDDDLSLHPLDGRWFFDRGELESGENLDELFLEWVWVEFTSRPLLEERRVAWDAVRPLRERVVGLELVGLPTDIQARLDDWTFGGVATRTEGALAVLEAYEEVTAFGAAQGLDAVNPIAQVWSTLSVEELSRSRRRSAQHHLDHR